MVKTRTLLTILTYLIGLLGGAAVFPYLDPVARIFVAASFAFGIAADRKGRFHLRGITPTMLSIVFLLYYYSKISTANLVGPVINLVAILLSVRLAGEKTERNCMQIAVLSLFALAGSSLLNLGMTFLFYLISYLVFVAVFLVFLTFRTNSPAQIISGADLKRIIAVALAMPAISFPLLMLFFMLLPRTQYPMWNFLNGYGRKVAGFSEKVEPGGAAVSGDVKTVAFRVRSPLLPDSDLYWRGIVLNSIEGNIWVRSGRHLNELPVSAKGVVVRQTFYPEPNTNHFLITLDSPNEIIGVKSEKFPDKVFAGQRSGMNRFKYDSVSVITDSIGIRNSLDRDFYLRTPNDVSTGIIELARKISGKGGTDAEKVDKLEQYYFSGRFVYSNDDLPSSDHPMDAFLFEKKKGNCELFASSFALLLRLAGVPSRLVGGYFGGEYNSMGGYYIVTEDRAHVWVEAFIGGKGWIRIDPTAFSAGYAQAGNRTGKTVITELRMMADSLGYYWNKAVIGYDLERQVQIIRKTDNAVKMIRLPSNFRKITLYLVPLPLCVLIFIFRKKCRYVAKEEKILRKFLKKAGKICPGAATGPSTGLRDLSEIISRPDARRFVDIYCRAVYRDRKLSDSEYAELKRLVGTM